MYSAYKLNKQGENILPWHTRFLIWNQSVVPCPVLAVPSRPSMLAKVSTSMYMESRMMVLMNYFQGREGDTKRTDLWTQCKKEGGTNWESRLQTYFTICKMDSRWECAIWCNFFLNFSALLRYTWQIKLYMIKVYSVIGFNIYMHCEMIIMIKLINIPITSHSYLLCVW